MTRLDRALVERGMVSSRTQSDEVIASGMVQVNGNTVGKASHPVDAADKISVTAAEHYVARSVYKLKYALDTFTDISAKDKNCLDIGASTGGFTQVLLESGARKVIAVDVGHGQMASAIANHPRVHSIEGANARYLTSERIGGPVQLVTSDVSFISSTLILPSIAECAQTGADILVMVKPQFEVGKERLPRGAVVISEELRRQSVFKVARCALEQGLCLRGLCRNVTAGRKGNVEFFLWLKKPGGREESGAVMRSAVFSSILKEEDRKLEQWVRHRMGQ